MTTATMPRTLDAPLLPTQEIENSIRYAASHRAPSSFSVSLRRNIKHLGAKLIEIFNAAPPLNLRTVAIALLFFSAATSLTVGVIVLNWSGVDVIVNAGPIALIAAGGAAFAAMLIAITVHEEN
jgi:hypothetical protein